jgi:hypothetical protein
LRSIQVRIGASAAIATRRMKSVLMISSIGI